MSERAAVESALAKSANITEAAKALGSSRRTLQSRMRDFGIPAGKPGRPRELLPYKGWSRPFSRPFERLDDTALTLGLVAVVGVGAYLVWRHFKKQPATLVGEESNGLASTVDGLSLLGTD